MPGRAPESGTRRWRTVDLPICIRSALAGPRFSTARFWESIQWFRLGCIAVGVPPAAPAEPFYLGVNDVEQDAVALPALTVTSTVTG